MYWKRIFDIVVSLALILLLLPIMVTVALLIKATDRGRGPVLYWSKRVGRRNKIFLMPKFRTMGVNTPQLATHLLQDPKKHLSAIGTFLRTSSIDELPQLYSVIKGDMSLIGPRPALFNQQDLIALRSEQGIEQLLPGITGWAQVNGRDEISIAEKVNLDLYYLENSSFTLDIRILIKTVFKVCSTKDISH